MGKGLFLGVADNGTFSLTIAGDEQGRIVASVVGDSIDYHAVGMKQARTNLQEIIHKTVGLGQSSSFESVCLTYQTKNLIEERSIEALISDILDEANVYFQDFATSSTMGINSEGERLLLIGGNTGFVIYDNGQGKRYEACLKQFELSCQISGYKVFVLADYVERKCLLEVLQELDLFVERGNDLALRIVYNIAYHLVNLVMQMAHHFREADLVIGLYGKVLLGSRAISARVQHLLSLLFPQAQVVEAPFAPVQGAYLSSILTRKPATKHDFFNLSNTPFHAFNQKASLCLS